jgi:hypothetical protein
MSLLKKRSQLLKFLKGLSMFHYKKYLIAALALLLSGSIFAADFTNEDTTFEDTNYSNLPISQLRATERPMSFKECFEEFDLENDSEIPQRPINVDKMAFYARHFLGFDGVWLKESSRYQAVEYDALSGRPLKLEPLYPEAIHFSLLPNADHLMQWQHIDKIYLANGTRFFALEFWRDYCNTHNPEIMMENLEQYAKIFSSKFSDAIVNEELLQTILESKSHQPSFTGPGRKLIKIDTMEKHMDELMNQVRAAAPSAIQESTSSIEEKVEG